MAFCTSLKYFQFERWAPVVKQLRNIYIPCKIFDMEIDVLVVETKSGFANHFETHEYIHLTVRYFFANQWTMDNGRDNGHRIGAFEICPIPKRNLHYYYDFERFGHTLLLLRPYFCGSCSCFDFLLSVFLVFPRK